MDVVSLVFCFVFFSLLFFCGKSISEHTISDYELVKKCGTHKWFSWKFLLLLNCWFNHVSK